MLVWGNILTMLNSVSCALFPPWSVVPGIDFSRDGCYMALAERRDCRDYVSVFVCDDWHLLRVSATQSSHHGSVHKKSLGIYILV